MKKLPLVVALLFVIQSVVTQAPGDGSETCLPGGVLDFLRFTIPENMKVLMDSRDYEFLLGNLGEPVTWQQVDVDGIAGGGTTTIVRALNTVLWNALISVYYSMIKWIHGGCLLLQIHVLGSLGTRLGGGWYLI